MTSLFLAGGAVDQRAKDLKETQAQMALAQKTRSLVRFNIRFLMMYGQALKSLI